MTKFISYYARRSNLAAVFFILLGTSFFWSPSAQADNTWQTSNGNVVGDTVQFDWRGGSATYVTSASDGSTVSLTVNNTIANCIGSCTPIPDVWTISINGQSFSGDTIEVRTVTAQVSGQVTIVVTGRDVGFWGGWYGPIFYAPTITAPTPTPSPSPLPTETSTPMSSPTETSTPSASPAPSPTPEPSPSPSPSPQADTSTVSTSPTPAPSETPTVTTETATHWISSGYIGVEFADVLPLTTYTEGGSETVYPDPGAFYDLCVAAGIPPESMPSEEMLNEIYHAVTVYEEEPFAAMARINLHIANEETVI